jgi:DNA-binding PadR family transcriptional regulator
MTAPKSDQGDTRSFRKSFPVLEYLAIHPNITPYKIEKKTKLDRPTLYAAISRLERAGLIEVDNEKALGRVMRREYKITYRGVVALLQAHGSYVQLPLEYIRLLAVFKKRFLPLVFGKWSYFQKSGVEETAYELLFEAVKKCRDEVELLCFGTHWADWVMQARWQTGEPVHRNRIYAGMFVNPIEIKNEKTVKWLEVLRSDQDILRKAEREIEYISCIHHQHLDQYAEWLNILKGKASRELWLLPESWEEEPLNAEHIWEFYQCKAIDEEVPIPTLTDTIERLAGQMMNIMEERLRDNPKSVQETVNEIKEERTKFKDRTRITWSEVVPSLTEIR